MSEEKPIIKTEAKAEIKKVETKKGKLVVVLIRGFIGMHQQVKDTLHMLKLRRKHACVVLENNPSNMGMINKIKNYTTYGEIDDSTLKELVSKRGKEDKTKKGRTKGFFSLAPPKGGFERKGIKKDFTQGGALGNRGTKINDLIKRMI